MPFAHCGGIFMNVRLMVFLILAFSFLIRPTAEAQRRVDARHTYERLIAVVPMVGKGTYDDPRRPKYAPVVNAATAAQKSATAGAARSGIIGYHAIPSDDGQYALVEFVAVDRAAFAEILADESLKGKVFEKGKGRREDMEREFVKHKRSFNLADLGVMVP
jgi:hypothetical protein